MNELPALFQTIPPSADSRIIIHPNKEGVNNIYGVNFDSQYFKLVFFPRNALPYIGEENRWRYVFIERAPWVNDNAWEKFNQCLGSKDKLITPAVKPSNLPRLYDCSFYIESSPSSLLTAALYLDPKNDVLDHLATDFSKPLKPPVYEEFIDLVLAGKFINLSGELKNTPDFEGEMLMLAALVGDRNSAMELIKRKLILDGISQPIPRVETINKYAITNRGLKLNDLVAVHATDVLPYVDSSGTFILSRFNGSKDAETRLSIHFALNHHVVSHSGGDWDNRSYAVIVPLTDLIDQNGPPTALRAEDTYFTLAPGQGLKLPKNSRLIRPKNDADKTQVPLETTTFGIDDFSEEELTALASYWSSFFWSTKRLEELTFEDMTAWHGIGLPGKHQSLEDFIVARLRGAHQEFESERISSYLYGSHLQDVSKFGNNFFTMLKQKLKLLSPVKSFLDQTIWSLIPPDVSQIAVAKDYPEIRTSIQRELGPLSKFMAVENAIRELGFEVKHVDPYYLEDLDYHEDIVLPEFVADIIELAEKAGIPSIRHFNTSEGDQDQLFDAFAKYVKGQWDNLYTPYEKKAAFLELQKHARDHFIRSNPQYRRMAYLTGVYNLGDLAIL